MLKKVFIGLTILGIVCLFFIPIEGNYKTKSINEKDSTMLVTYASLIPVFQIDTIVKMPRMIKGQVITNGRYQDDEGVKYTTITRVCGHIYNYTSFDAYNYVQTHMDNDSTFKCEERFWPEHYVITIENGNR